MQKRLLKIGDNYNAVILHIKDTKHLHVIMDAFDSAEVIETSYLNGVFYHYETGAPLKYTVEPQEVISHERHLALVDIEKAKEEAENETIDDNNS